MKRQVEIKTENRKLPVTKNKLKKIISQILRELGIKEYQLSIALVGKEEITRLNKTYLKKNRPTDFLSFPYQIEKDKIDAEIIVSLDQAEQFAKGSSKAFANEIILYIIHGILHLAGYDDKEKDERQKMWRKQRHIYNKYCLK